MTKLAKPYVVPAGDTPGEKQQTGMEGQADKAKGFWVLAGQQQRSRRQ
jgi:hypothetical protein